jgi:hypothetical protein
MKDDMNEKFNKMARLEWEVATRERKMIKIEEINLE